VVAGLLLGIIVYSGRSSRLLATGHRGVGGRVIAGLRGPLLLRGRLLLPLGGLILKRALRESGDGWKS
jgi:hypothetical protein